MYSPQPTRCTGSSEHTYEREGRADHEVAATRRRVRHDYTLTNPTAIPVPDRSDGAKCIAVSCRKKAVLSGRGSVRAPGPIVWDDQCLCEHG